MVRYTLTFLSLFCIDATVSRHHADISIVHELSNPLGLDSSYKVILKDVSKFVQTAVNNVLLTPTSREVNLRHGDVLKFGAAQDTFRIEFDPIILAISDTDKSESLMSLCTQSGVVLTAPLTSSSLGLVCTSLDSSNPNVLHAILRDTPIISPGYLEKLSHVLSGCTELPDISDFAWEVPNTHISRSSLFRGMLFLPECDLHSKVCELIPLAGGEIVPSGSSCPASDLYLIVDNIRATPHCEGRLERVRIVDAESVMRCIFQGEIAPIADVAVVSVGMTPSTQPPYERRSEWIGGSKSTDRINNRDVCMIAPTGGKRFKKQIRASSSTKLVIPLVKWDKKLESSSAKRVRKDDIDDWLIACRSSQ